MLPSWNKTGLDRSIRRALERADGSRPVVAHSGILPHPAWGTDSHLYFGWYHGEERDLPALLARAPVVGRFVSEFGAQAVPETADFMHPERWPDLDWDHLEAHHGLQRAIFDGGFRRPAPPTFADWQAATQQYQATLLRHHIETLRRLKYRPTGRVRGLSAGRRPARRELVDPRPPAPAQSRLWRGGGGLRAGDRHRRPARPASYRAGTRVALDVHVVSDLRTPLAGVVAAAVLRWPGAEKVWRYKGEVPADSCVRVGRVEYILPGSVDPGPLTLDLTLRWDGGGTSNSYSQSGGMRTASVARFLSPEWFAEVARQTAGPAGRWPPDQPSLVLEQVVRDGPEGEVRYQVVVNASGAYIEPPSHLDSRPAPDLTIVCDWSTATGLAQGTLSAQSALMEGRLRVSGNLARLVRPGGPSGRPRPRAGARPATRTTY